MLKILPRNLPFVTISRAMSQRYKDDRVPPPPIEETKEEKAAKYGQWKQAYGNEKNVILDLEKKLKNKQGARRYALNIYKDFMIVVLII